MESDMSYEERGTWVYLVVSVGVYATYVAVVLAQGADPITETAYEAPLLWSIGAAILASIVLRILVEIGAGIAQKADPPQVDPRDREIDGLANQRTWLIVAAGALAALLMALAEWHFFWIANVIYLGFVLQAVASSIVKLVFYRRGF